jgi:hypothetical protein
MTFLFRLFRLITFLFALSVAIAFCLALSGCSFYRERFTHYPTKTDPGHVVDVVHVSIFQFGSAAKLTTSTQTEEFIRDVNAEGIVQKTDGAALGEVLKRISRP